ncbi:MAG: AbrB/MazE/SpoVT family DNA-binding domain-containing protein [Chloroflexi bacterium]|nr:AbrB/MazE/SpoVT family DNA-binding domain-containing protein [Chloroflexota bacterium]
MIVKLSERGTITIPREVRDRLPEGVLLDVVLRDDGVVELRPQLTIDAAQTWFWKDHWQQMEREADADVTAGRIETLENVEDFLADLDAGAGSADARREVSDGGE